MGRPTRKTPVEIVKTTLVGWREGVRRSLGRRCESRIRRRGLPDWRAVPVIINNRDRLEVTRRLIDWLETAGMKNIVILDNASTYPPLLAYYETTRHRVIRLARNIGHRALWRSPVHREFRDGYYVLTDPDVIPDEACPMDAVRVFLETMQRHPHVAKVGFGLRIDDIPPCYALRDDVLRWEKRFWSERFDDLFYRAEIDTTFALYRPWVQWGECLRSGPPYVARHAPWYQDSEHPSEEEIYYTRGVMPPSTWWTAGSRTARSRLARS